MISVGVKPLSHLERLIVLTKLNGDFNAFWAGGHAISFYLNRGDLIFCQRSLPFFSLCLPLSDLDFLYTYFIPSLHFGAIVKIKVILSLWPLGQIVIQIQARLK